jgi:hypothetical protein
MNVGRLQVKYESIWKWRFLWFGLHLKPGTRYYFSQRTFIFVLNAGPIGIYWWRPFDLESYTRDILIVGTPGTWKTEVMRKLHEE